MALFITEHCIDCYGCETVCPQKAISIVDGKFVINPTLCNECEGDEQSRCRAICPVDNAITKAS